MWVVFRSSQSHFLCHLFQIKSYLFSFFSVFSSLFNHLNCSQSQDHLNSVKHQAWETNHVSSSVKIRLLLLCHRSDTYSMFHVFGWSLLATRSSFPRKSHSQIVRTSTSNHVNSTHYTSYTSPICHYISPPVLQFCGTDVLLLVSGLDFLQHTD